MCRAREAPPFSELIRRFPRPRAQHLDGTAIELEVVVVGVRGWHPTESRRSGNRRPISRSDQVDRTCIDDRRNPRPVAGGVDRINGVLIAAAVDCVYVSERGSVALEEHERLPSWQTRAVDLDVVEVRRVWSLPAKHRAAGH